MLASFIYIIIFYFLFNVESSHGQCGNNSYNIKQQTIISTCIAWGSYNLKTFDDHGFSFRTDCPMVLVSFQVGTTEFRIDVGKSSQTCRAADCYTFIDILYNGEAYRLDRNATKAPILTKGKDTHFLPVEYQGITIVLSGIRVVVKLAQVGVVIKWDVKNMVEVSIENDKNYGITGLCGNNDKCSINDQQSRAGALVTDLDEFLNDWKVSLVCPNMIHTQSACRGNIYHNAMAKTACRILTNAKFEQANNMLNPELYKEACIWSYCACVQRNLDCLCETLDVYAKASISAGVNKISWRSPETCPSSEAVCSSNRYNDKQQTASSMCMVWGSYSLKTFDDHGFSFRTDCPMTLVSFQVGTTEFRIDVGKSSKTCKATHCYTFIDILYNGHTYRLGRNATNVPIFTTEIETHSLPVKLPGISVVQPGIRVVVELARLGVVIKWDEMNMVEVSINNNKSYNIVGLCGNNDKCSTNDQQSRTGALQTDLDEFLDEWKISVCPDKINTMSPCRGNKFHIMKATSACEILMNARFKEANSMLNPELYKEACIWSYCACVQKNSDCLCETLDVYAKASISAGVNKISWRSPETCQSSEAVCSSNRYNDKQQTASSTCMVWGSYSLKTFDDHGFSFRTDCPMTLVSFQVETTEFRIDVGKSSKSCKGTDCYTFIDILYNGQSYRLDRSATNVPIFTTEMETHSLPVKLPGISVVQPGIRVVVELAQLGVVIKWDEMNMVEVSINNNKSYNIVGLCGNNDKCSTNDQQSRTGALQTDFDEFLDAWKSYVVCPDKINTMSPCRGNKFHITKAARVCEILRNAQFKEANNILDPELYKQACVWAHCACTAKNVVDCLCETLDVYAKASISAGVEKVSWRNATTCQPPEAKCAGNRYNDKQQTASSTCMVWGSYNLKTFDDHGFSFRTDCPMTLVSFQVGTTEFRIDVGKSSKTCKGTDCYTFIDILYNGQSYRLGRSATNVTILTAEKETYFLPVELAGISVVQPGIRVVLELARLGVVIKWDEMNMVEVSINNNKTYNIVGLCGNNDKCSTNDQQFRTGALRTDLDVFLDEWKVSVTCPDIIDTLSACSGKKFDIVKAERSCEILRDARFKEANNILDPELYTRACVWAHCACATKNIDCICETLDVYAKASISAGVEKVVWRNPTTCEKKCAGQLTFLPCAPRGGFKTCSGAAPIDILGEKCEEGCYCSAVQYFLNGNCYLKKQCPCVIGNMMLNPGDVIKQACHECICKNGIIQCPKTSCITY